MDRTSMHVVCPHCGAVNRIPTARRAAEAKCGQCHRPLFEGRSFPADSASFERSRDCVRTSAADQGRVDPGN